MSALVIAPPRGAVEQSPRPLSVEEVPGAQIALHRQWAVGDGVVSVACVTRPVPLWIDGLMPAVLGGMNGMLRRHLALTVVRPDETVHAPDHWSQGFTGTTSGDALVVGRHLAGFAAQDELLACTKACEGASHAACTTALAEVELVPGFVVREQSFMESALAGMVARPRVTLGLGLAMLLLFVVALLARRPRVAPATAVSG